MRNCDNASPWGANGRTVRDRLGDETRGLDIAGVRGLDQSLEAALVNEITTVSLRGRYYALLPWAIGEYFAAEVAANTTAFDEVRFKAFLARVEFLALPCTTIDEGGGNPGGALCRVLFQPEMAEMLVGEDVDFPTSPGDGMLGTYFGLFRAPGLVRTADGGGVEPFVLTPRGQTGPYGGPRRGVMARAALGGRNPQSCRYARARAALFPQGSAKAEDGAAALREALLTP
jgi:hypothetical protein